MSQQERRERLNHLTEFGPNYSRNVTASLSDFDLWAERGHESFAERALLTAEWRAGMMTFEEWQQATAAIDGQLAV